MYIHTCTYVCTCMYTHTVHLCTPHTLSMHPPQLTCSLWVALHLKPRPHRVGLPTPCLTVGKHSGIVALKTPTTKQTRTAQVLQAPLLRRYTHTCTYTCTHTQAVTHAHTVKGHLKQHCLCNYAIHNKL